MPDKTSHSPRAVVHAAVAGTTEEEAMNEAMEREIRAVIAKAVDTGIANAGPLASTEELARSIAQALKGARAELVACMVGVAVQHAVKARLADRQPDAARDG